MAVCPTPQGRLPPTDPQAGQALAIKVVDGFASCPIPEVARLGRTLKQWKEAFLAYFDTDGATNVGCGAVNGLIELHRRMLLIAGGLDPTPPPQL